MKVTVRREKRGDRKVWVVDWSANGKRQRLFRASKALANTEAENIRLQFQENGSAWMLISAAERNELLTVWGEVKAAGLSLRDVWQAYRGDSTDRITEHVSLATAIEQVLVEKRRSGFRETWIASLKLYLGMFAKGRESMLVDQITADHVRHWFDKRTEKPATQQSNIRRLGTFFASCLWRGWIIANPCANLDPVRVETRPPLILTPRQSARPLLVTLKDIPRSPCLDCPWAVLWPAPIRGRSYRLVRHRYRQRRFQGPPQPYRPSATCCGRMAQTFQGHQWGTASALRQAIRFRRAEMGWKGWPARILRHTAASYWLAQCQDAGLVASELGNSAGILLRHSHELVYREDADRFWSLKPKPRHFSPVP